MRNILVLAAPLLSGCAGGYTRLEGPVVDMRGIDANKHNQDLVKCQDKKREASFVRSARIITDRMQAKGLHDHRA